MHKSILDEHGLKTEFLSAEPCKAFLVDKGLKGMEVCHEHIDPHIEFIPIEQQRINYVLLHDYVIRIVQLCQIIYDLYSPPSGFADWLHYPVIQISIHDFLFMEFDAELSVLLGEVKS